MNPEQQREYEEWVAELAAQQPTPDVSEPEPAVRYFDTVRADTLSPQRVRYLWDCRVPLGALTVMPGEEGIGKSTIGANLISAVTRGRLPGEFLGIPRNVYVLAIEDGLEDVWVPRLQQADADMSRVVFVRARLTQGDEPGPAVIIPDDLPYLASDMTEHDPALVWIDALVTTLPDDVNSISYKDIASTLLRIKRWAEQHQVSVVAPWHLNKGSGTDTALRMMDSRAFRTASRSVLLVAPDPEAPPHTTRGIVALDKTNAGTLDVPALRYEVVSAHYTVTEMTPDGFVTVQPATTGVLRWLGEVEGDGRSIARAALAPRLAVQNDVAEWLTGFLGGGPIARADVIAAGEVAGFSESAIGRAARNLVAVETVGRRDPQTGAPTRYSVWRLQSGQSRQSGQSDLTGEGAGLLDSNRITTDLTDVTDVTGRDLGKREGQWGQSVQSSQGEVDGRRPVIRPELPTHPCPRCGQLVHELPEFPDRVLCARCRYVPPIRVTHDLATLPYLRDDEPDNEEES